MQTLDALRGGCVGEKAGGLCKFFETQGAEQFAAFRSAFRLAVLHADDSSVAEGNSSHHQIRLALQPLQFVLFVEVLHALYMRVWQRRKEPPKEVAFPLPFLRGGGVFLGATAAAGIDVAHNLE